VDCLEPQPRRRLALGTQRRGARIFLALKKFPFFLQHGVSKARRGGAAGALLAARALPLRCAAGAVLGPVLAMPNCGAQSAHTDWITA
jgi:hypothetical protein